MGIWVGRYAIVGGEVREHGPWLVDRARTAGDDPVRLLVLAEPVDERSAEFCEEVASAVAELFARESLSITGGLLRALQQAHANLEEWNRRSLREHRIAVGITCVAVRDSEATIAIAGPGVVYLSGRGGNERLTAAEEPAASPLGGSAPVEPLFRTVPLEQQDLLLISGAAEQLLGREAITATLAAGPQRALAELFVRTRELPEVTAVLIAELEGAEDLPPAPAELSAPPAPGMEIFRMPGCRSVACPLRRISGSVASSASHRFSISAYCLAYSSSRCARARAAAWPRPTMPGVLLVPARRPRSWLPP